MLLIAAVLLMGWLIGVSLFDFAPAIHVVLLVGLLLLLLGFLKARDAAVTVDRAGGRPDAK